MGLVGLDDPGIDRVVYKTRGRRKTDKLGFLACTCSRILKAAHTTRKP